MRHVDTAVLKASFLSFAFAILAAPGCSRPPSPEEAGRKADIILVTVDALRADHLGIYGYARPTSPNIDAFAREAAVVRNHISQAPYTKASMASLFSGLFPTAHKAYTTSRPFGEAMTGDVEGDLPVTDVLDPRIETLAERLASAGYQTHGLNTNPFLLEEFGFGQGFQQYQFLAGGRPFSPARDVVARALEVLEARDTSRPLFLWMHLMEPHSPYVSSEEIRRLFPPRTPPLLVPAETIPAWIVREKSRDARFYEALYDASIREADEALGTFFAALDARRAWDSTIVVITADHGEEFFEHGGFEHNRTLYDEMLRVPLIVRARGLEPGMRNAQTQSVDLVPTFVDATGLATRDLQGVSIWPVLRGHDDGEPYAVSELVGERYALRTKDWKLISTLAGSHELYDLRRDPHERQNLVADQLDRTARLRDVLMKIVASSAMTGQSLQGQFAPIQPRVLERLKALGYIR